MATWCPSELCRLVEERETLQGVLRLPQQQSGTVLKAWSFGETLYCYLKGTFSSQLPHAKTSYLKNHYLSNSHSDQTSLFARYVSRLNDAKAL